MTSQVNLDKKRVAHIGNQRKNNDEVSPLDIVSDYIKSMESKKIISYKELEDLRERQNLSSLNPEVTAPEVKTTKKFLLQKKHPLMEKCQKNLKYLKHNRSVPKQRAHVGEISFPKNIPNVNPITNSNATKVLNVKKMSLKKKSKIISKKEVKKFNLSPQSEKGTSDLHLMLKSVGKQSVQVSKDSSDSDCKFEEFIRVQKEPLHCEDSDSEIETSCSRRKKKKQKIVKCNKKKSKSSLNKNLIANNVLGEESEETDFVMNESCIDSDSSETTDNEIETFCSRHKKKKQKVVKCNKKKSKSSLNKNQIANNKLGEESEESDFEINESYSIDSSSSEIIATTTQLESDNDSSINSSLSLDLTKTDTKGYISKNFSCSVRLERNPVLDKKAISSSMKETSKNDVALSSNKNESTFGCDVNKSFENHSSEDDCMIICEVPKSNSTYTVSEKSGGSALCEDNLSLTSSNKTWYTNLDFELQDKNSEQSKVSSEIDACREKDDNVIKSNDESEIQILCVETLNTYSNSKEQKQITLNENSNHVMQVSNLQNTDYFVNKNTFDPKLLQKDFFKYAKTYSEPQNLIDNAQIIPEASKKSDFTSDFEINECLDKIDLNLVNSTLKQVSCSEHFINDCDKAVLSKNIPVVSSLESTKHLDSNCDKNIDKLSTNQILNDALVKDINLLPSHVLEMAQKIDFKKIVSLTKFPPNEITENNINCSMKSLNESSTYTESDLLKSSQQSVISTNAINSHLLSPNETNNKHDKLDLLHRFGTQTVESCSQKLSQSISELTDSIKTKVEKYIESPSDELDVIAAASIHNLNEQKSKDFIPLFNLYINELTKYKKIKSAEQNVSEGLKILEETQFEKLKYLDRAIQNILQHDPCSLKIIDKAKFFKTDSSVKDNNLSMCKQDTLNNYQEQSTLEDTISIKQQAEICDNCGLLAKLKCLGCEKVFFCSKKCGLKFWKEGHSSNCQKNSAHVKIEN